MTLPCLHFTVGANIHRPTPGFKTEFGFGIIQECYSAPLAQFLPFLPLLSGNYSMVAQYRALLRSPAHPLTAHKLSKMDHGNLAFINRGDSR